MQRARGFKKKLAVAWIILGIVLTLAFYSAFHIAGQTDVMNHWANHSQEVLGLIARVRLERSRLTNLVWAYRATRSPDVPLRFQETLHGLQSDLATLGSSTADNPSQTKIIAEVTAILTAQCSALQIAMQEASSTQQTPPSSSFDWSLPSLPSDRLRPLFEELETNERALLASRAAAVQAKASEALVVVGVAALLAFGILAAAGYLIQRELLTRASVEEGLRHAQELLGTKFEDQRVELGHALEDLHQQIRARQSAEEEVRKLNEDLEKRVAQRTAELAEMNRELESFSYSVSHDLRAPLRHMEGFSRILEDEFGSSLPQEAGHYLERIRGAATHMSALVEGLLQLSRLGRQSAQHRRCSLCSLAQEARSQVAQEYSGRPIDWRIGSLPEIEGDPILLRQVLVNLFSNAAKFTRLRSEAVIEIGSRQENGNLVVFVRDNGAGFDPRYADKLFGVFQRLHRQDEFEGTGIGLATVQRIIRKHGGQVWADSQQGQGATFYLSLPSTAALTMPESDPVGATA